MLEKFAERLKEARKKQGLTLMALQEKSGIHYQTISFLEHRRHGASLESAALLADALGVSLDWLAGRE